MIISIKKTKFMGQGIVSPPSINIDNVTLDAVDSFTYLCSTIDSNLSLDAEIHTRIAKAAASCPNLQESMANQEFDTNDETVCLPGICS